MKTLHLNRRQFIQTMAAVSASAYLNCGARRDKPNLLFIWTDQQRADTMQAYGNSAIHTPNFNNLTSESVVFQNGYVSQPVCTPSRSTVMTGLWPHTNGCVENNIPLSNETECFPELLADPDYRTGYFGKWHLGDEIFAQHGFEEWQAIEDGYTTYYSESRDTSARSEYHHFLVEHGYEPNTDSGTFSRGFAARLPLEHTKPKFLEMKTIEFLRQHKRDPFCLFVNFLEPHSPYFGPLDDEHDLDEVHLPENIDDELTQNDPLRYRLYRRNNLINGREGFDLSKKEEWRQLTRQYWGLVRQVDLSVGAILSELEKLGLADNTIVVFTSDHGDMMGSHRLIAKTVMYDEATKVPWIMRIPQQGRKQQSVKNPASHIDLVPTLLELMGKPRPEKLQGTSLVSHLKGESKNPPDDVFIEWNPNVRLGSPLPRSIPGVTDAQIERVRGASIRTVVTPDGWKLNLCDHDKSQLFSLKNDPYETTNLFYDNRYQDIINRLTTKITDWQSRSNDPTEIV